MVFGLVLKDCLWVQMPGDVGSVGVSVGSFGSVGVSVGPFGSVGVGVGSFGSAEDFILPYFSKCHAAFMAF